MMPDSKRLVAVIVNCSEELMGNDMLMGRTIQKWFSHASCLKGEYAKQSDG